MKSHLQAIIFIMLGKIEKDEKMSFSDDFMSAEADGEEDSMRVSPVKNYKAPKYPDKRLVLDNPSVLKMNLPHRWRNNVKAFAAMSALLAMSASGCGKIEASNNPTVDKEPLTAPIFEHGDGRGSFGCVSVSPPAFLSEEEAFDVIRTETEKMGLSIKKNSYTLKDVKIPCTTYTGDTPVPRSKNGSLELDGFDNSLKIGVEFISEDDYRAWESEEEWIRSTVSTYDFLDTAKKLRDGIEKSSSDITVGIFYDPMPELDDKTIWDENIPFEEKAAMLRENSLELLRNQVKDFLEWLKSEGII